MRTSSLKYLSVNTVFPYVPLVSPEEEPFSSLSHEKNQTHIPKIKISDINNDITFHINSIIIILKLRMLYLKISRLVKNVNIFFQKKITKIIFIYNFDRDFDNIYKFHAAYM